MEQGWRLAYAIGGLLIASGLLTYLTKPAEVALPEAKKKRRKKAQLGDARPYLTEEGYVALDLNKEQPKMIHSSGEPHLD